jgi:hypothetical protein
MKKIISVVLYALSFFSGLSVSYIIAQPQKGDIFTVQQNPPKYEQWKFDPEKREFSIVWTSPPFFLDKDALAKYRRNGLIGTAPSFPVISDIDEDGRNELIACDKFGILVYGESSQYYPFPTAQRMQSMLSLLVEDVNQDGRKEIVTCRPIQSQDESFAYELAIWQIKNGHMESLWSKSVNDIGSYVLAYADANNDGKKELITASGSIAIWKKGSGNEWEIVSEIPNRGTLVDVVKVADVDGDGKNEILATGNGEVLTIYKHRQAYGTLKDIYPVMWQSEPLGTEGLRPREGAPVASAYTQGLDVGDLDGDGLNEILVGTSEDGVLPNNEIVSGKGKIHIFRFLRNETYKKIWSSEWTVGASVRAFTVGDIDSDNKNEFVYHGSEVYKFAEQDSQYKKIADLPAAQNAIIGQLSGLTEPLASLRIIPIAWNLPIGKPEQAFTTSLAIRNVWAEAKNVKISLRAAGDMIIIENGVQDFGTLKSGEIVESKPITVRIGKASPRSKEEDTVLQTIWIEVTAQGGYRQLTPITIVISLS